MTVLFAGNEQRMKSLRPADLALGLVVEPLILRVQISAPPLNSEEVSKLALAVCPPLTPFAGRSLDRSSGRFHNAAAKRPWPGLAHLKRKQQRKVLREEGGLGKGRRGEQMGWGLRRRQPHGPQEGMSRVS